MLASTHPNSLATQEVLTCLSLVGVLLDCPAVRQGKQKKLDTLQKRCNQPLLVAGVSRSRRERLLLTIRVVSNPSMSQSQHQYLTADHRLRQHSHLARSTLSQSLLTEACKRVQNYGSQCHEAWKGTASKQTFAGTLLSIIWCRELALRWLLATSSWLAGTFCCSTSASTRRNSVGSLCLRMSKYLSGI